MEQSLTGLRLGLIANDESSLQRLEKMLDGFDCQCPYGEVLSEIDWQGAITDVQPDAWIVCVDDADNSELDDWLAEQSITVMLADEAVPASRSEAYPEWRQRWLQKLRKLTQVHKEKPQWPKQLWVLAASTGGPEAVGEFLSELPANLDAGFIYIQHSSVSGEPLIRQVVAKRSVYPMALAEEGQAVAPGKVWMLGASRRLLLNSQGLLESDGKPWASDFSPSIDQFVYSAASRISGQNNCQLGVIIFSGMAGDGAEACRFAQQRGVEIWTQSPESCISPFMPMATAETAQVKFSGSPKQLAEKLCEHLASVSESEDSEETCLEKVAS
ncbi:chemotaxis protein CheB [Pseudoteredinibacter isoporae]|uniref:chemotaxis protein CheB n=1 Tax=Pseudoteredinibacter isoporae TaxID=570281 RepID=UPI00310700E4